MAVGTDQLVRRSNTGHDERVSMKPAKRVLTIGIFGFGVRQMVSVPRDRKTVEC